MRHIARVLIENFQSHSRSELVFGPGLNVIVGPSDNGKSAVLRAIRWVLYNEPRGTEFVRSGARECRATLTMSDGAVVVREVLLAKSGTPARNRYIITAPGGEPQTFEGFGTAVPPEVTRLHGMPEVLLDTDKRVALTFGSQLEGPFLMAETGSMRARAIGRLLGVHVVDAAIRETQRDLRTLRGETGRLEREAQRLEAELAPFADTAAVEGALERAQGIIIQAEMLTGRKARLSHVANELERVAVDADRLRTNIASLERVPQAAAHLDAALARLDRLVQLRAKLTRLQDLEERAAKDAEALQAAAMTLSRHLAEYEAELRLLNRCPTCGQPMGSDVILRMVAEAAGATGGGHAH